MTLALKEHRNPIILVSNGDDTGSGFQDNVEPVKISKVQFISIFALRVSVFL